MSAPSVLEADVQLRDNGHFIAGRLPTGLAWLAFTLVALGTARNAYRHLLCYSRPDLQQHVLRIILVGPLYAFSAALCLSLEDSGCFFVKCVREVWEAVVIYSFLTLIIEYMGGEHLCLHSIADREEAVPHLFPLNLCLPPIPTGSMIRAPKIAALQFVVVKPIVGAVSILVYACGKFEDWYYQWTLFVILNISYTVALYGLYLMYWASHGHASLQSKRPLLKFLSVKMIVFLTFWQALMLPHTPLPGNPRRWEDFILAVEMLPFGLLMNAAFSWKEFHSGLRGSRRALKCDAGDVIDFEAATTGQPGATGQPPATTKLGRGFEVVQNAKAAFCPRDILVDASANFSRRYQQHVLIESAQEYELRASDLRWQPPPLAPQQLPQQPPQPQAQPQSQQAAGEPQPQAELPPAPSPPQQHAEQQAAVGQPQLQEPAEEPSRWRSGSLRTFRARTYLIGKSLGLGGPHQQLPELRQIELEAQPKAPAIPQPLPEPLPSSGAPPVDGETDVELEAALADAADEIAQAASGPWRGVSGGGTWPTSSTLR